MTVIVTNVYSKLYYNDVKKAVIKDESLYITFKHGNVKRIDIESADEINIVEDNYVEPVRKGKEYDRT